MRVFFSRRREAAEEKNIAVNEEFLRAFASPRANFCPVSFFKTPFPGFANGLGGFQRLQRMGRLKELANVRGPKRWLEMIVRRGGWPGELKIRIEEKAAGKSDYQTDQ